MNVTLKQMTDFLSRIGAADVGHTEKTYLAHAVGVHYDLKSWGASEEVCRAGMFHSVYGTERFQKFVLPLEHREELRELIGKKAERLAYLNCAMDRQTFDECVFQTAGPWFIVDRFTGEKVELTSEEFDELCRIHLCDWLEQVPRAKAWDYRRAAYRRMAERVGGIALEAYERVFALENEDTAA